MRISDLAVDNKVAVYIFVAIVGIIGWFAYAELPRDAAPDISIPLVIVTTPYPGVSPSDIEGLVTQPLERKLKALKDVNRSPPPPKRGCRPSAWSSTWAWTSTRPCGACATR